MATSEIAEDTHGLLQAWRGGDLASRDRLFAIFYPDLRRSAAAMLRRQAGVSLSTSDLIHETVTRLVALNRIEWNDRAHFLALSATMMRRTLLDHARAKRRNKRDHQKVELMTGIGCEAPEPEIEALNAALDELARIDPERAAIVEMRYFGGMELADVALVLGISESTVKRRWTAARLWLLEALTP